MCLEIIQTILLNLTKNIKVTVVEIFVEAAYTGFLISKCFIFMLFWPSASVVWKLLSK